jgi:hypothetical protein
MSDGDELKAPHFSKLIDYYLATGRMDAEAYEGLSDRQKDVVQVIKRAFKRLTYGDRCKED